jgi:hypothetical protein
MRARVRVRHTARVLGMDAGLGHIRTCLALEVAVASGKAARPRKGKAERVHVADHGALERRVNLRVLNVVARHVYIRGESRRSAWVPGHTHERHCPDTRYRVFPPAVQTLEPARAAFILGPRRGVTARGGKAVRDARIRTRVTCVPDITTAKIDTTE